MKSENNAEIMLSIVAVSYNHEKYMAKMIESIVGQKTKYCYELLIGDDASTDATQEIISNYHRMYPDIIVPILRCENVGATKNGYELIQLAKGKYIAFCDGDDYWNDIERVEKDICFLEANIGYVGICGKCDVVDECGNPINVSELPSQVKFWEYDKQIYEKKDFEEWKMPGHISSLTMRNIYKDKSHDYGLAYKSHGIVGDRTTILLAILNGNIMCIDEIRSCYRLRVKRSSNNFMSEFKKKNMRAEDFAMIKYMEDYSKNEFNNPVNLKKIKLERLVGSVVVWMKNPTKDNKTVINKIIEMSNERWLYRYYALKTYLKKTYYWKILKKDKRITL